MPELLTPGVYIQEVDFGPQPIEGVSTSTAGFVGEAERGPTEGPPTLVTSLADFQRKFGGFVSGKHLAYAVRGFFENGGRRAYVSRVADDGATQAVSRPVTDGQAVAILAAAGASLTLSSVVGLKIGANTLKVVDKLTGSSTDHNVVRVNGATGVVTLSAAPSSDFDPAKQYARLTSDLKTPTTVEAVNLTNKTITIPADPVVVVRPGRDSVTIKTSGGQLIGVYEVADFVSRVVTLITDVLPASVVIGCLVEVRAHPAVLTAKDPGAFGNSLSVMVEPHYANNTPITALVPNDKVCVADVSSLDVGAQVEIEITAQESGQPDVYSRFIAKTTSIDVATKTVTITPASASVPSGKTLKEGTLRLIGWRATTSLGGTVVETLEGVSSVLDSSDRAGAFSDELGKRSQWVRAPEYGSDPPELAIYLTQPLFPTMPRGAAVQLASGADGTSPPASSDIVGTDVPPRTGLKALEAQDGISIIAAPGFTDSAVVGELIAQAERRMDRFAVFESSNAVDVSTVMDERGKYNSKFAAMYHPWVKVSDPLTKTTITVPPAGHILGAYARTDNQRGVFKAPANTGLVGVTELAFDVTAGEQDILNPAGVNVLRFFSGLGNVIWGARTISAEGLWKYVPVRRLFIMLEQSIIKGTRYAVFEPNDLRLWARLRDSVTNFLTTQWRAGALFGAKPEEAFFVKVDETTTTQDDRDNGRVNIIVGIAPVKPAEFIVFQIGQAPSSVVIAERS